MDDYPTSQELSGFAGVKSDCSMAAQGQAGDATMATALWEIIHSVEANASPAFAWQYWTDVANWDDPPAKFELNEPFSTGSHGLTRLPGQEPLHWFLREVVPPSAATIEISLDGAVLSFEWRFAGLANGRTLLTQRIVLKGENANTYLSEVKAAFTANPPVAMSKLATAIANADPSRKA